MTKPVKTPSDSLTKLDALRLSLKMWKHIEATGVGKIEAMEALGMCSSDYLAKCPCCEYTLQQSRKNLASLQCKEYCPAWLEFSEFSDRDTTYPCVRNPISPYYRYSISDSAENYKQTGRGMVKLLNEAYERNLKDSELD